MKNKFWIFLVIIFIMQIYSVSALTINSVNSNPSEIEPGENFVLNLKIENNLNEDIESVTVSLDLNPDISPTTGQIIYQLPFAPYKSSNEARIDEILEREDEKASFDLTVFSDASSGTYMVPVQVSYTLSDNGTLVKDENLGLVSVIINAKPKMDVSSESNLIKGTKGKISLKIINSGLGNAKFLSVNLNQIAGIQITSSKEVYIGNR